MNLFKSSQDRDIELLSAFLDNELSPTERARLERRIQAEPQLRSTLDGLRRVQTRLSALPRVKVPRSFTLKPGLVGQPRQPSALIPVVNYATALAATLFAVLIGADLALGTQPAALREQQPEVAMAPADVDATSMESVQLAPEASPKAGGEVEAPATAGTAYTFGTEASTEPLTGDGGQGGGGGAGGPGLGGGGDTSVSPPVVTDQTSIAEAYSETPTPDGTLRIVGGTETPTPPPVAVEQAPVTNAVEAQEDAAAETLTPIRIGIGLAGLAFLILIGVSVLLRR